MSLLGALMLGNAELPSFRATHNGHRPSPGGLRSIFRSRRSSSTTDASAPTPHAGPSRTSDAQSVEVLLPGLPPIPTNNLGLSLPTPPLTPTDEPAQSAPSSQPSSLGGTRVSSPSACKSTIASNSAIALVSNDATNVSGRNLVGHSPSSTVSPLDSAVGNAPIMSYEAAMSESPNPDQWAQRGSLSLDARPRRFAWSVPGTPKTHQSAMVLESEDEAESQVHSESIDEEDPMTIRPSRSPPQPNLIPLRRHTVAELEAISRPIPPPETEPTSPTSPTNTVADPASAIVELHPPPANLLPAYTPHLANDELRLISTVHLDQTHPSAAFFSAIVSSVPALAEPPMDSQEDQPQEWTTGGKKLRLTLTRGGYRPNANGTGPLSVKIGRGGVIEGRIEVGKVDHGTSLEVTILGLVQTSGIDTMPLTRRVVRLYPPGSGVEDDGEEAEPPAEPSSSSPTAFGHLSASASPSNANAETSGSQTVICDANDHPLAPSKEGQAYLTTGMVFPFAITIPHKHWRDESVELPPSCQAFQAYIQAGVEYLLRVKLSRKSWRMSRTLTVPITYQPGPYLSTRRLRALTVDDVLNPGWRTIKLHGGGLSHRLPGHSSSSEDNCVEAALLLPSPPILYIAPGGEPPPIPFHLHFHSPESLPLLTFSDPMESDFIVRLMRVWTIRIGIDREIGSVEIPSKVEIWQEGGPRVNLGEERPIGGDHGLRGDGRSYASPMAGNNPTNQATTASDGNPAAAKKTPRRSFFHRRSSESRQEASQMQRSDSLPGFSENQAVQTTGEQAADPSAAATPRADPFPFTPLALGCTDVHLLGQLTINPPFGGTEIVRKLIPSFQTPELMVSYIIEIGIRPRKGAVKEAFKHVWGGGLIEVVLGAAQ